MNDNKELEQIIDSEENKEFVPNSDGAESPKRKVKMRKKNWRTARKKAQKKSKESRRRNR